MGVYQIETADGTYEVTTADGPEQAPALDIGGSFGRGAAAGPVGAIAGPLGLLYDTGKNLYNTVSNALTGEHGSWIAPAEGLARDVGTAASGLAGGALGGIYGLATGGPAGAYAGMSGGAALGNKIYDKLNQLTGSDEPTSWQQDVNDLAYNTAAGLTGLGTLKGIGKLSEGAGTVLNKGAKYAEDAANTAREVATGIKEQDIIRSAKKEPIKYTNPETGQEVRIDPLSREQFGLEQPVEASTRLKGQLDVLTEDGLFENAKNSPDSLLFRIQQRIGTLKNDLKDVIERANRVSKSDTGPTVSLEPDWSAAQRFIDDAPADLRGALQGKLDLYKQDWQLEQARGGGFGALVEFKRTATSSGDWKGMSELDAKTSGLRQVIYKTVKNKAETAYKQLTQTNPELAGKFADINKKLTAYLTVEPFLKGRVGAKGGIPSELARAFTLGGVGRSLGLPSAVGLATGSPALAGGVFAAGLGSKVFPVSAMRAFSKLGGGLEAASGFANRVGGALDPVSWLRGGPQLPPETQKLLGYDARTGISWNPELGTPPKPVQRMLPGPAGNLKQIGYDPLATGGRQRQIEYKAITPAVPFKALPSGPLYPESRVYQVRLPAIRKSFPKPTSARIPSGAEVGKLGSGKELSDFRAAKLSDVYQALKKEQVQFKSHSKPANIKGLGGVRWIPDLRANKLVPVTNRHWREAQGSPPPGWKGNKGSVKASDIIGFGIAGGLGLAAASGFSGMKNEAGERLARAMEMGSRPVLPASASPIDKKAVSLVSRVIKAESGGNKNAVSKKGARGLMQIMPETAKDIARQLGIKKYDLHNAEDNIKMGTFYLKQMLLEFGGDTRLALAAYNMGPNGLKDLITRTGDRLARQGRELTWQDLNQALPSETRGYVKKILG